VGIVVFVGMFAGACSGGGSAPTTTVAAADRQQGALAAARACRMWTEIMNVVVRDQRVTPALAAPLDARAPALAAAANQASNDDPAWNDLATDVAGATDFASAALPDIDARIRADCQKVPSSVVSTVAKEPDPFSTTTTATTAATATTATTAAP
jgi:hypothetical protein